MNLGYFDTTTLVAMRSDCDRISKCEVNAAEVRDNAKNLAYVIAAEIYSRDPNQAPPGWRFH